MIQTTAFPKDPFWNARIVYRVAVGVDLVPARAEVLGWEVLDHGGEEFGHEADDLLVCQTELARGRLCGIGDGRK